MNVTLNNKLGHEWQEWSARTLEFPPVGVGLLFEGIELDARVGLEVVAVLCEPEPDESLLGERPTLCVKGSLSLTTHGPVILLFWWIPQIINGRPVAFYEQFINPRGPRIPLILGQLADQTHLHVLLVDLAGKSRNIIEIENVFGFDRLPARIRTDNGAPFAGVGLMGLSKLALGWMKLGIIHERIQAGRPQQNGRHERMHRTLKEDTTKPPASSLRAQQSRFDKFRYVFNNERPHEGLKNAVPCQSLSSQFCPTATQIAGVHVPQRASSARSE